MVDLKIQFATKEQARAFATWLCEAGEQHYWNWGEMALSHQINREKNKDYVAQFDYHNGGLTEKDFCTDLTIRTCGLLASSDDKRVPVSDFCPRCAGQGVTSYEYPEPRCPDCLGTGIKDYRDQP